METLPQKKKKIPKQEGRETDEERERKERGGGKHLLPKITFSGIQHKECTSTL